MVTQGRPPPGPEGFPRKGKFKFTPQSLKVTGDEKEN
jgi:hypothetical protein